MEPPKRARSRKRRTQPRGVLYTTAPVPDPTAPVTWRLDRLGRRMGEPVAVGDLTVAVGRRGFRRSTWRAGSKEKLSSKFYAERVVLAQDDGIDPSEREAVWLLIEWPDNEDKPSEFTACTLPATMTRRQLVRRVKERWRTERVYEDAKGELGLDHFEGRTYRGWHHHVSVVLCCFAFIVAERERAFPPSAGRAAAGQARRGRAGTLDSPPRAPLRRLVHHRPHGYRASADDVATAMPTVPTSQETARHAWCTCPH